MYVPGFGMFQWRMEHEGPNECDINFDGSSPPMEAEAAAIPWERGRYKYRWKVCDVDNQARSSVEDSVDSKVEKLDCVGHKAGDGQTLAQFESHTTVHRA